MPGFNADKLRHAGLGPQQSIGELRNIADHTAAGTLFINAQLGGFQIGHAVAVMSKEVFVNGNCLDIRRHQIQIAVKQAMGQAVQADGRFQFVKPQLIMVKAG